MDYFTVVWLPDAEQELAKRWLESPDRDQVTNSASRIESLLRVHPEEVGESRAQGRRILIVPPLAVTYRVLPDDRTVQVVNVRDFYPKQS
jgi:hypothetical protein